MAEPITPEEIKTILEGEIAKAVRDGWRVLNQTDHTAQMVRNKRASCLLTIILLLFLIVPGVLYWLLYKGEESMFIEVDHFGHVKRTRR